MIKYVLKHGVGRSKMYLPSFDKALIEAEVGNYNLVRLSSILPANSLEVEVIDITEGSLLPTAYATITSDKSGDHLFSGIMIGFPEDENKVGVIMEYSCNDSNMTSDKLYLILLNMVQEAFAIRGWKLKNVKWTFADAVVEDEETVTTFACVSEWGHGKTENRY